MAHKHQYCTHPLPKWSTHYACRVCGFTAPIADIDRDLPDQVIRTATGAVAEAQSAYVEACGLVEAGARDHHRERLSSVCGRAARIVLSSIGVSDNAEIRSLARRVRESFELAHPDWE